MTTQSTRLPILVRASRPQSHQGVPMYLAAAALFEQSADLIWTIDLRGRLVSANPAFCAALQAEADGIAPGHELWQIGPPLLSACYERGLRGETLALDLRWGQRTFELSVTPQLRRGRVTGALLHARDVTAVREELASLRRHVAALEAQNSELTLYTQQVAHDLKNPLAGIATSSEMLRRYLRLGKTDGVDVLLGCIDELALRGSQTVEELLRLARQGFQPECPQPVELGPLVADVCARFAQLAAARGATVTTAECWPAVSGQPALITSILENYLANALKYGGEPPRISIGAELQLDGRVRCWVRDEGPGLSLEEQAVLFAPYVRLRADHTEGHGLGLALVRHSVERMGGSAGVESAPGRGACFFCLLPAAPQG